MTSRASTGPSIGVGAERNAILLVGMMGAGKSVVARRLAEALGWSWVDTDRLVEEREGMPVATIFATSGEEGFRDAEASVVSELGKIGEPVVVSLGGGSVLRPENRAHIRSCGTVVWLRARAGTLAARVGTGRGRPLLSASVEEPRETSVGEVEPASPIKALQRLAAQRQPVYAEVADLVIDIDELSEQEVVERVLAEVTRVQG
jgi:shikimate kinase